MKTHRHAGLCGPECPYRGLYEGSQASLSDMASAQASALNRVARLRSGVVMILKQAFPVEFGRAEEKLGRRLSTTDDEVLLAYLKGFAATPTQRTALATPAGLEDLRDELTGLGIGVPAGTDLRAWSKAVALWAQEQASRQHAAPPEPAPSSEGSAPSAPGTGSKGRKRTGAKAAAAPAATSSTAAFATGSPAAEPSEPAEDPLTVSDGPAWDEDLQDPGDFEDGGSFDDQPTAVAAPAPAAQPAPPTVTETPGAGLGDLFGPEDGDADLSAIFDDPDELVEALFSDDAEPEAAFPTPPTVPGLPAAADPSARGAADAAPDPQAAPTPPSAPAKKTTNRPASASGAMRPELFPSAQLPKAGKARRTPRTSRVSAAPPDPRGLDVPIADGASSADLTDELFDKLVASVCIPRPVFVSDLVAQTGSPELVSAWEQRCRDMGTASPVRFITPKPRHRDRGALIVPHSPELRKAASEFTKSWWATCLDERRLRGAALYEVAVLLHRFGDTVISSRIEGDVLVLRLNQPRGLVGVAMALGTDLAPGGSTRTQVADAVGELVADRLTLIAVLTYSSGGGTLEKLATAVREECQGRGWSPSMSVIASLSWDFAADGGSSAMEVL